MRISDWSSDVCSSDLLCRGGWRDRAGATLASVQRRRASCAGRSCRRSTLLESDGGGTRARTARPRPICRYADMAARRHFDQDRPDEHGGQPGGARAFARLPPDRIRRRSEEHTSELQSLMRISYAVFCLKKKTTKTTQKQQ